MIDEILKPDIQQFIREHENEYPADLMLQSKKFSHWPLKEIVQQIQARQKAKNKLPSWLLYSSVVFHSPLAMEQCSSEWTARYKASLFKGEKLIDLTGGAGIDSYYFSKSFSKVMYVEKNTALCELARHNLHALKATNIDVVNTDAEDYLKNLKDNADVIYLDPSRRNINNQRVVMSLPKLSNIKS